MTRFQSQRKQKYTMNLSTKQKQAPERSGTSAQAGSYAWQQWFDPKGYWPRFEQALEHHELIKVKIASEDRETKTLIVEAIVRETGACNVQVIGKTLVLYRPTKERKISLPR
ncbi:RNA-binding protein YhbY [Citrobacter koseri]|uniref:RNA-binding protein YhbY n=1 Tax=Citrobacter koseri TaxID=545 RepID=A0A3S4IE63_CITKO|nr:RNA-binding protein YhbY [Citrobacter koseri]